PADRLANPIARRVADDAGLAGFAFERAVASASATRETVLYPGSGTPLFQARGIPLEQGVAALHIKERARTRAGLAALAGLALFIVGVWRGTRTLSRRIAALAVALACTALVPLNEYSNLTRLFGPAVYHAPILEQFSANAGALLSTSAAVLLGILALFGRRPRPLSRAA